MKRWKMVVLAMWMMGMGHAVWASGGPLLLWDVAGRKPLTLEEALPRLLSADIILVGEVHDRSSHHQAELAIIRALHQSRQRMAVGLEMVQHRNQQDLDRWVAGRSDETDFKARFSENWGPGWPLYREIFLFCREQRIPMVGLNVPPEISEKVAREGFSSLTPEEVGMLPPITCKVGKEYTRIMRRAHGHMQIGEAEFNRFCEAQLVWDTAMAVYSDEYLNHNPGVVLVVLTGAVHAWKEGIPAQLRRVDSARKTIVILPETENGFKKETATVGDCDYLMLGL